VCAGSSTTIGSSTGSTSFTLGISVDSSMIDSEVVKDGSTSRGMIDDSRPENERPGAAVIVESASLTVAPGLPVEEAPLALGGSICPGRAALFVKVLGVANLEILKVLTFGVALKMDALFADLLGEPVSATFVGDWGRRAGDPSSEALNGEFATAAFGAGKDGLNGDCSIVPPNGTL